jgi:hypothetical protein
MPKYGCALEQTTFSAEEAYDALSRVEEAVAAI